MEGFTRYRNTNEVDAWCGFWSGNEGVRGQQVIVRWCSWTNSADGVQLVDYLSLWK